MTQDNPTIEGNKLIAEFMGGITDNGKEWAATNKRLVEKYEYHTSWDWLMPVVEKISMLENDWEEEGFSSMQYSVTGSSIGGITLKTLWQKIVQFITWYNQQNQKQ